MDREVWWATVYGVAKELDTTQQLITTTNALTKGEMTSL